MSFSIRNNFCHKCGKPLSVFEQGLCVECETAEKAEQGKCEHNCEECEHNDGECCRILFERSFEQNPNLEKLRAEIERATIEMDYETAKETLAVIDRYIEQEPCDDAISREDVLAEIVRFSTEEGSSVECQQLYCDVNNMPSVTQKPIECDDVVSRQAYLLDWLCRLRSEINCCMDMASVSEKHRNKMISVLTDVIKQLSSVQPKPTECEDAVSRQAVLEIAKQHTLTNDYLAIQNLPSVRPQEQTKEEHIDVFEVVNAPWIFLDNCANSGYYCSKCKKKLVKDGWSETVKKINFCPNCGANMVKPQESCEKCLYAEETDGSHCYECVKGESKFEPQESEV